MAKVMKRRKLAINERKAIWEHHKKRSPYNGEVIQWNELEIEHVIPIGNELWINAALERGIVKSDFDFNGYENLLPCHNHQNSKKSDIPFDEGTTRFFLSIASNAKPGIEKIISAEKRNDNVLNSYLKLKLEAEKNDISVQEMFEYVRHRADGEVPLRIVPALEGQPVSVANSSIASTLMERKFWLLESISEFELHNDEGQSQTVSTVNEYNEAVTLGYYPLTTFEIKVASAANETSGLLKAVRDSAFATSSRISLPNIDLRDLGKWGSKWASDAIADFDPEIDLDRFSTLEDLVAASHIEVTAVDRWELHFRSQGGLAFVMKELLRADLDGDGEEEILIYHYVYATEGTFGAGIVQMAKIGANGLLQPADYS